MIKEIGFCEFCNKFEGQYSKNFSHNGKEALFEYLEDDYSLDVGELCQNYSEFENINEYLNNCQTDIEKEDFDDIEDFEDAVFTEIEKKTTLIKIENSDSFLIQNY